jgi:hypothetical protein
MKCGLLALAPLLLSALNVADPPTAVSEAISRAENALVAGGASSNWSFSDTGSAPSADWRSEGWDASSWKSGPAPLGYGEKGLGTTLDFGGPKNNKAITAWFRQTVEIKDASRVATLVLQLRRDDVLLRTTYFLQTRIVADWPRIGSLFFLVSVRIW